MPPPDTHPLTLVHWQDSKQPLPAWCFLEDLPPLTVVEARTVGFVVGEDDQVLMLAQSLANAGAPDAQVNGVMQIPKRCITHRHLLSEGRAAGPPAAESAATPPAPQPFPFNDEPPTPPGGHDRNPI